MCMVVQGRSQLFVGPRLAGPRPGSSGGKPLVGSPLGNSYSAYDELRTEGPFLQDSEGVLISTLRQTRKNKK